MLDTNKIEEARKNIARYLEEGSIVKVKQSRPEVLRTYKRNYKESYEVAKKVYSGNISSLWVVVASYYSMFYAANAVIYKIGYKIEGDSKHKKTYDALIIFVRDKLKKSLIEDFKEAESEAMEIIGREADEIIKDYERELDKRSIFQYKSTEEIKRARAKTSLERAERFIFEMEKLLL